MHPWRRAFLVAVILATAVVAARADAASPWRWVQPLAVGEDPTALAVDAAGDVVAAAGRGTGGRVLRLAGGSGRVRWRRPSPLVPLALAVGVDDDPVIGGTTARASGDGSRAAVARLARRNGDAVWQWYADAADDSSGADRVSHVRVDARHDVVVGGDVGAQAAARHPFVAKLDGDTGAERWRFRHPRGCAADAVDGLVLGPDGTPVVAVRTCGAVVLVALDAVTGAPVWEGDADAATASLAAAPGGRVAVHTADGDGVDVRMLDAATGAERWRWVPENETLLGGHVLVAPTGEVVVTLQAVVVFPGGAFRMQPTVLALTASRASSAGGCPRGRSAPASSTSPTWSPGSPRSGPAVPRRASSAWTSRPAITARAAC